MERSSPKNPGVEDRLCPFLFGGITKREAIAGMALRFPEGRSADRVSPAISGA
jgi:hypothetical protein